MSLNNEDIENCLIRFYFNPRNEEDLIHCIVRRAYRDLNRTIHGISKLMNSEKFEMLIEIQIEFISDLLKNPPSNQFDFDEYHEKFCSNLKNTYLNKIKYNSFYIGQAQKWINMSLKYIYVLSNKFPDIMKTYQYLHIPIDQIILTYMRKENITNYSGTWSKIDNYQTYLKWQKEFAKHCGNFSPIEFETRLFNKNTFANTGLKASGQFF